jgi:hypothetical protein
MDGDVRVVIRVRLRAILPRDEKLIDPVKLHNAMIEALDFVAADFKVDFSMITATWEDRPLIRQMGPARRGDDWFVRVYTEDRVMVLLDQGTVPHPIRPRRAPYLVFRSWGKGSYRSKTRPGWVGSRAGGSRGPTQYRQLVFHPGTEAREFAKAIEKRERRQFVETCKRAVKRSIPL